MIFGAFERMVALRYLRARRQEGFISVIAGFSLLGIALGVATLIIVMAVMNGFRQELMGRILGVNGHVTVSRSLEGIADYDDLVARLAELDGVISVVPQIQGQVGINARGTFRGALVRGVRAEDFSRRKVLADSITAGSLEAFAAGEGVLVGHRLARQLGLTVGRSITLISPRSAEGPFGPLLRKKDYPIVGLFDLGMHEYDSSFIYMPLEQAQIFFKLRNKVNAVELFFSDPDRVWLARAEIAALLGSPYRVVDWQQANSSFFNAIQVERNVMFLILSLIILVAAFNILSGQYMLVKSKRSDIAVLRTMGATRAMVMRIFFLTGASIGLAGTVIGVILGLVFTENIESIRQGLQSLTGTELFSAEIYFLSKLPAVMDPVEVAQVILMALFLSFLAPIFPAWRAARLDPVEALRYE
jgi:lipoprotein-releasing system permease protein